MLYDLQILHRNPATSTKQWIQISRADKKKNRFRTKQIPRQSKTFFHFFAIFYTETKIRFIKDDSFSDKSEKADDILILLRRQNLRLTRQKHFIESTKKFFWLRKFVRASFFIKGRTQTTFVLVKQKKNLLYN